MTGEFLREYHRTHYRGDNTVVAPVGELFPGNSGRASPAVCRPARRAPQPVVPAVYTPAFVVTSKPIEQNHLTLAFPGLDYNSPKRFALQLLSSILGGGVSSRLFQQVRERQGLCYTIYSYGAGHADTGVFCIYTALNKETEAKALATIRQVVDQLRREGPTSEELERAREQSKANVVMGLESTQSRMSHAGRSLLFSGEILTPEQITPPMTASPTRMWWLWPRRFSAGIRSPSPLWARCGPPRRTGRWCWRRKAVEYCLLHRTGAEPQLTGPLWRPVSLDRRFSARTWPPGGRAGPLPMRACWRVWKPSVLGGKRPWSCAGAPWGPFSPWTMPGVIPDRCRPWC